jgi:hypothetical protein
MTIFKHFKYVLVDTLKSFVMKWIEKLWLNASLFVTLALKKVAEEFHGADLVIFA